MSTSERLHPSRLLSDQIQSEHSGVTLVGRAAKKRKGVIRNCSAAIAEQENSMPVLVF